MTDARRKLDAMRRSLHVMLAGACLCATAGCLPDLGECDEVEARTPWFRTSNDPVLDGRPLYGGQAMMQVNCSSNGAFCHSSTAVTVYGAPGGLDFNVAIACPDPRDCDPDDIARLSGAQRDVYDYRQHVLREVQSGDMPPGRQGRLVVEATESYRAGPNPGSMPLPAIDSREGEDLLRNWLACGSPVVERILPETESRTPGDNCTSDATAVVGDCIVRSGSGEVVPEPTFGSIYSLVLQPQCGASCHSDVLQDQLDESRLDLRDRATAYDELVTNPDSEGSECEGMGHRQIVPGDPEASLLIQKLRGTMDCGDQMPIGVDPLPLDVIAAIEEWIRNGADND